LHEIVPEAPFQLRLDRVLWLGLWAASLFVLSLLLVASLSGGSEREFVIGGQPPPSEAANITSGQPGAAIPSLAVGAPSPLPSCLQGSVNECQCQDFAYQGDAQKFFTAYAPPARQPVDPDGDGLVCEWLSRRPGT
jgi:hypothetical protein